MWKLSKISAAQSARTAGAKGINSVRCKRSFSQSLMSGSVGAANIDRLPSARGPYSIRPSKRATTLPWCTASAMSSLPVPLSPSTKIVVSVGAMRSRIAKISRIAAEPRARPAVLRRPRAR